MPVLTISLLRRTGKAGTLFRMGTVLIFLIVIVCGAGLLALFAQREVFPANIIANMFNFAAAELFLIQNASERATPKASFT